MSDRNEHQQLYDLMQKQVMNLFQKGSHPMTLFGIETKTLKEALPTELPMINDYSIDYGFLDEESDLHHVEFQTDFKEEDVYRFNIYHALLKDKYKKGINRIFTYIIFHSKEKPADYKVKAMQLKDGGDQSFTPTVIFMKNEKLSKEAEQVWDKVRTCTHIELKPEELAMLIYSMFGDMDRSFLEVATELLTISEKFVNEDQQKMLVGCVVSLSNRILKKEEFKKIEGMLNMGQLVEKFESDIRADENIKKAAKWYLKGTPEEDIKDTYEFDDNQMKEVIRKAKIIKNEKQ
ncbi:hypothetical protein COA01_23185 [Bacillus cereus]|uniref:hypothetical protein n=1 Tax=Bacillus cereus TaxID=1396 RepID=UPI000BFB34F5|nr:hypothetical protein [Bacillus cereus]PGP18649.1 hypothetical protein COA01_23185 [Bacillus cereus]